jgi:hypothetical protein
MLNSLLWLMVGCRLQVESSVGLRPYVRHDVDGTEGPRDSRHCGFLHRILRRIGNELLAAVRRTKVIFAARMTGVVAGSTDMPHTGLVIRIDSADFALVEQQLWPWLMAWE